MTVFPRLLLAVALTAITIFLGILCLVIGFEMIRQLFQDGAVLSGKDTVFVPLVFLATYFLVKWTREAWARWNRLRRLSA